MSGVTAGFPTARSGSWQTYDQLLADDVFADPVLQLDRCTLAVPWSGLGIILDDDKVDRYAALFEHAGQYFNFPTPVGHR